MGKAKDAKEGRGRAEGDGWAVACRLIGFAMILMQPAAWLISAFGQPISDVPMLIPLMGALLLLLGHLDRLESFRFGVTGLEARLQKAAQHAEELTAEAKRVLLELAKHTAESMELAGRWGGAVTANKEAALERIIQSLKAAKFTENEIEEVTDTLYPIVCFDYAHHIWEAVSHQVPAEHGRTVKEFWDASGRNKGFGSEPTPEELDQLITRIGLKTPWIETLLDDYRHFKQQRAHRNMDRWRNSHRWREGPI
jgi:hypothetical protein